MHKPGDRKADYLLFIVSFIIAWIEVWFFE